MNNIKTSLSVAAAFLSALFSCAVNAATLAEDVQSLYDTQLKDLFIHFHENPELSFKEDKTAARLGDELEALGYTLGASAEPVSLRCWKMDLALP